MLVLSRKKRESIEIGGGGMPKATLTVVDIRGDKVRIGIEAPRDVPVHRSEVADEISRQIADRRAASVATAVSTETPAA